MYYDLIDCSQFNSKDGAIDSPQQASKIKRLLTCFNSKDGAIDRDREE